MVHPRSRWDRNDIYTDFDTIRADTNKSERYTVRRHGDINGGGDEIDLKSDGGSIYIRKASQ